MINTILIDILRTFSDDELKKFEEMIRSVYFNKHTPLIKLFDQIKKYHPDFKSPGLKKETVYTQMFPDKKYNYGSMKNLIYGLQTLSEEFITDQEIKKNKFDIKKTLINSLQNRNLTTLSEKNLRELEKETAGKEISEDDYFLKLYYINKMKQTNILNFSKGNLNITEKIQTPYFEQFLNSSKYLKKYYQLVTLKSYSELINYNRVLNMDQVIKNYESFISLYNEKDFEDISLKLETGFLKMNLERITEDEFLDFKKLVLTDLYAMKTEKYVTFSFSMYLINYCNKKAKSDRQYMLYAFEILKNLAKNNNLNCESGYLDIVLTRNIVLISSQLKEFKWCEKFLELYLDKIHPDYKGNLMKFYHAQKNFHIGLFDKSLEYLSTLNFDDIFNKSNIKELQVRNYYELKYFDLLNEQLESYKKFLTNNKRMPEHYKITSTKFVSYMFKLFKAASGKKTDLLYLKARIQNEKDLIYKRWFLNKVSELIE